VGVDNVTAAVAATAYLAEMGGQRMTTWLNRKPPPVAVFCFTDELALGALRALADQSLRAVTVRSRVLRILVRGHAERVTPVDDARSGRLDDVGAEHSFEKFHDGLLVVRWFQ